MLPISLRPILLFTAAIVAIGGPILTYSTFIRGSTSVSPGDAETTTTRAIQNPTAQIEIELITLRPSGCEPSEITRQKGPFVLVIDDRSGKQNSSPVLQRVTGERLRTANLNRKKSEWHDLVDLPPGTYVLKDSNNTALQCQITIVP